MSEWLENFLNIAEVALAAHLQLLEALGVVLLSLSSRWVGYKLLLRGDRFFPSGDVRRAIALFNSYRLRIVLSQSLQAFFYQASCRR
ncbi:hypothetical protein VV11_017960 [Trichodesmium erythraeum 21-75]|nr:hypothetical protein [Trichodesmium erythraeum 21-75]